LNPNAVVARDYQVTVITTTNGRVLNGIIKQETDQTIVLQTQNEVVRVPRRMFEERRQSALSMMPEGQLATMSDARSAI